MAGDKMRLIAGLGLRHNAQAKNLAALLAAHCPTRIDGFYLPQRLRGHALTGQLAQLHFIPETLLRGIATPSQSPRLLALYGTGSLSEAAALYAAGPDGRLIAPRFISPCARITLALAMTGDQP